MADQSRESADYGLDAPGIVTNLMRVAGIGAIVLVARFFGLWSGHSRLALLFYPVMSIGAVCLVTAWAMIWYSRVGKYRARDRMFDSLNLTGNERVLDIGCGRGLWLVGAAKRLAAGKAVGIDIWNTQDLSDNAAGQTWKNARVEGVADRIELLTADARQLPFEDESFDLIVSSMALHNLYEAGQREQAVSQIVRTLCAGGRVVIFDIRHISRYADVLAAHGLKVEVTRSWTNKLIAAWTLGSLIPGRVTATKPIGAPSTPKAVDSAILLA